MLSFKFHLAIFTTWLTNPVKPPFFYHEINVQFHYGFCWWYIYSIHGVYKPTNITFGGGTTLYGCNAMVGSMVVKHPESFPTLVLVIANGAVGAIWTWGHVSFSERLSGLDFCSNCLKNRIRINLFLWHPFLTHGRLNINLSELELTWTCEI